MEKASNNENKIPLTEEQVLSILQYIPRKNLKKKQRKALYKISPLKSEKKLGRNDPCKCGSGEKYKYCCLTKDEAQEYIQRIRDKAK